jgi:predicted HicB family RNase H-like nuclease
MTQLLGQPMARQKRNDRPVKIDASVYRKAQIVAAGKGISLAEYLSELLRPLVNKDYIRQAKEALKEDEDD